MPRCTLFTVELLRGLQERGDLLRDRGWPLGSGGRARLGSPPCGERAVIATHIGRLPSQWQALLAVASVEGEDLLPRC